MTTARIVNGEALHPLEAYRLGSDYLITRASGPWYVSYVTGTEGDLRLTLVDSWYELADAVQGALFDRQQREV